MFFLSCQIFKPSESTQFLSRAKSRWSGFFFHRKRQQNAEKNDLVLLGPVTQGMDDPDSSLPLLFTSITDERLSPCNISYFSSFSFGFGPRVQQSSEKEILQQYLVEYIPQ